MGYEGWVYGQTYAPITQNSNLPPTESRLIRLSAELQASEHLLSFFPDISLTLESYLSQRNTLQDTLWPTVPLLPGVRKLILHLKAHNIPIAVATGSRRRNFELKTGHLDEVFGCFEGKVICGDDEKWGMRGKPEPDIFVVAAREMLGRDVGEAKATDKDLSERQKEERGKGLVLEDGLPGMQAGKRAGMSGVWSFCAFPCPTSVVLIHFRVQ